MDLSHYLKFEHSCETFQKPKWYEAKKQYISKIKDKTLIKLKNLLFFVNYALYQVRADHYYMFLISYD